MSRRSSIGSSKRRRRLTTAQRAQVSRSPQGRKAVAQRGGAERSASPRETEASEDQRAGRAKIERVEKYPTDGARVLHLDVFSGIAGNMLLGALLDAGLSRRELVADLAGLGLDHRLIVRRVRRGILSSLYVDVQVPAPRRARGAGARGHT